MAKKQKTEKGLFLELERWHRKGQTFKERHPESWSDYDEFVDALYLATRDQIRVVQVDATQLGIFANAWQEEIRVSAQMPYDKEELDGLSEDELLKLIQRFERESIDAIRLPFDVVLMEFTADVDVSNATRRGVLAVVYDDGRLIALPLFWRKNELVTCGALVCETGQEHEYYFPHTDDQDVRGVQVDLVTGTLPLLGGLSMLLESANVDVEPTERQYPVGHVAHKHGVIKHEVVIRDARRGGKAYAPTGSREYSHRFERRAHFVHHYELTAQGTENQVYRAWARDRPEKIVTWRGKPCVRIWRSASIVGPEDAPLVPKTRRVAK